ncbi:hypothetical protein E2C01_065002 [Portunus trituberculatus]|uniref:Uncharacterized protein n=1 Tax=Portunus trituberculatus TaxID=210409 RepID=A0A5B7HLD8_PORTR|nr:hypothetical protein [Portunus trituberculatus]
MLPSPPRQPSCNTEEAMRTRRGMHTGEGAGEGVSWTGEITHFDTLESREQFGVSEGRVGEVVGSEWVSRRRRASQESSHML